jgi:N-acetylglucosaminyl-diphospho-decaprenol L-rhamnosyltransferase
MVAMSVPIHIIIASHNAAGELPTCLAHLDRQSVPISSLTVVDSGSTAADYLGPLAERADLRLIRVDNVGYGRANNIGYEAIGRPAGLVVFLNPDTFLPPDYLAQAVAVLRENPGAAVVSGLLLAYDLERLQPTGRIDSAGIARKWYGRWYDRGQGEVDRGQFGLIEPLAAVCGALLCCRGEALKELGETVFDPDFFLYKEDIDLALRLRAAGWTLLYDPRLVAYHGRGWKKKRGDMPRPLRLMAAENEVRLYRKHPSAYLLWALAKLYAVRWLRL